MEWNPSERNSWGGISQEVSVPVHERKCVIIKYEIISRDNTIAKSQRKNITTTHIKQDDSCIKLLSGMCIGYQRLRVSIY